MEDVGAAVVAGFKTPPTLQSGKERLDFVAPAIQPLVVMDWFLAAATGRDVRRDVLLGHHLTDFVPVIPLIPHHHDRRRQVLAHHISTGDVTACPSLRWSRRRPLCCHRPHGACWSCPPWCHQSGGGQPPLLRLDAVGWALMSVASIISTLALGHRVALRSWMLTTRKRSDQTHPCLTSGGNGCRGFCGAGASPQRSPF